MKLVFCACFLCVGSVGVLSFYFESDKAAFGFETGKRRQEGAEILSPSFNNPPF